MDRFSGEVFDSVVPSRGDRAGFEEDRAESRIIVRHLNLSCGIPLYHARFHKIVQGCRIFFMSFKYDIQSLPAGGYWANLRMKVYPSG